MEKEIKFQSGITFKYQHIEGDEEKAIERFQVIVPFEGKDRICNNYNTLFRKKGDMLDKDEFNKFINFLKSENVIDKEFFCETR